ncbi:MAG: hypothetical protein LBT15_03620 [Synergistaceae bacterium]|nr:hypothetical protein [Synergistaceae bacterium]
MTVLVTIRALYAWFFVYTGDEMARRRIIHEFAGLAAAVLLSWLLFVRGWASNKWPIIIFGGVGMAGAVHQFCLAYRDSDWLMRSWGGIRAVNLLGHEYARIFFMAMGIVIFAVLFILILIYWMLFTGRIPDVR